MSQNILIVAGHTYPQTSIANNAIITLLKEKYPEARVDNLIELYPDFQIDVKAEQEKLDWADIVIIQTPLFWFSMTSMVQRWIEETFAHGWAYGSQGHALEGKKVIVGITAGAPDQKYDDGEEGISIPEIEAPLKAIFPFCGMNYLGCVFTGGLLNAGADTPDVELHDHPLIKEHVAKIEQLIG